MQKNNIPILLSFTVLALSVLLAGGGLAQEIPSPGCVVIDPGHPKKTGDETTFEITPLDENGLPLDENGIFPFPTTKENALYPCPGDGDCIAAPYEITGGKFNKVWLSFPVDENQFELIGVGPADGPRGFRTYAPCEPGGLLTSCLHWQIEISYQVSRGNNERSFVLYFKPVGDSTILGAGRGDFIGGVGRRKLICPGGIQVPSTEDSCVGEPDEGKGRQEVEAFGSVLFRTSRGPDGCAYKVEVCPEGCFYPEESECRSEMIDGYELPELPPELGDYQLSQLECGWQDLSPETDGPGVGENNTPIKDCGKTLSSVGIENPCLDECELVVAENPGWIWYQLGGSWYKICGGYYNQGVCCDTVTKVCCFIDGRCCDYTKSPTECWGPW